MILRLDFEKAYDVIDWGFLLNLLSKYGFKERWIEWISWYLKSARTAVITNGSPKKECALEMGVFQVDHHPPTVYLSW